MEAVFVACPLGQKRDAHRLADIVERCEDRPGDVEMGALRGPGNVEHQQRRAYPGRHVGDGADIVPAEEPGHGTAVENLARLLVTRVGRQQPPKDQDVDRDDEHHDRQGPCDQKRLPAPAGAGEQHHQGNLGQRVAGIFKRHPDRLPQSRERAVLKRKDGPKHRDSDKQERKEQLVGKHAELRHEGIGKQQEHPAGDEGDHCADREGKQDQPARAAARARHETDQEIAEIELGEAAQTHHGGNGDTADPHRLLRIKARGQHPESHAKGRRQTGIGDQRIAVQQQRRLQQLHHRADDRRLPRQASRVKLRRRVGSEAWRTDVHQSPRCQTRT